jgi:hypothetical protein
MDIEHGKETKDQFWSAIIVLLIGIHSILLGLFIYFFTDFFYKIFFAASVENPFFVRQSGIFLFLAGLFYLYPLVNLRNLYNLILLVIVSKIVAVYFLISNAGYTAAPFIIYLASFFDGLMALVLAIVYFRLRKSITLTKSKIIRAEDASLKEAA